MISKTITKSIEIDNICSAPSPYMTKKVYSIGTHYTQGGVTRDQQVVVWV